MKISLHRFESDPNLEQRDGVNLAHTEINTLLAEGANSNGFDVSFHSFERLLRDREYALATLGNTDCVLCNVGPHGHYYFYLRETLGLDFRIVRDIKTGLWSSYLLQESLCQPLLRKGDALLATSNYSRVLTRRLFPHLKNAAIHLFEPVLTGIQSPSPNPRGRATRQGPTVLGYVGRLSEDKNFPQVVELLETLNCQIPGGFKLVACGAVHSQSCAPDIVAQHIEKATGRNDLFSYKAPIAHSEVVDLIRSFDYFLFFSTSNLEVLGRVLIEAALAETPIIAARHGAAPELLPPSSLIDVNYFTDKEFYSHFDHPMGQVDITQAANLILRGEVPVSPPRQRINDASSLFAAICGQGADCSIENERSYLADSQKKFIDSVRSEGLNRYSSIGASLNAIEELANWFCTLNGKNSSSYAQALSDLERRSRFKERTRRFAVAHRKTRGDFTNLGGIDIELCNIAGFHPRFSLDEAFEEFLPHRAALIQA